jgi:5-methylcytosine-specific restriction endonuclease McrA
VLTADIFRERVAALWDSQKRMAAPRKFRSGRRTGMVRRQAAPIQFTRDELQRWLWTRVGLNAVCCPYCRTPIDIVSLTLDHIVPRSLGGEFSLDNLEPICMDCNQRKGNMTHDGFVLLLTFVREKLSPYDSGILLARLKAAHHGSAQRFFRLKAAAPPAVSASPPLAKPAQQKSIDFW